MIRNDVSHVQLTWVDVVLALAVGGLALFIYGRTLTPGLLTGDGGEFQTLPYLLGNTHPTGYPVYLVLARLFAFLPMGELAYRINLFSAVMGALAVCGLYLCGCLMSGYRAVAAAGALALAVSATFWSQSLIAEVYTAGAAFIVFILLALLWWDITGSKWALFSAGLLGGLGMGVHMSVALLAPAVLLFLLLHYDRGWPMWRTAVLSALIGLAITVLIFLLIEWNNPTASYFNSVIEPSYSAWGYGAGEMDGPLEHLWFSWQGRQFQYLMFSDVADVMPDQAIEYWEDLGKEFALPLIVMASMGALWLLLRRSRVAILLIVALCTQLFYFFNYRIWDLYVFYIPSYVLLTLFAIAGLGGLIDIAAWGLSKLNFEGSAVRPLLDISVAVLTLAFVVWPLFQPRLEGVAAGEVDFDFRLYPDYDPNTALIAAATTKDLPENAIVFTEWKTMWPYYYAAFLENDRHDLMFIETYPASDDGGLANSMVEFIMANLGQRPMFFEYSVAELEEMENISMGPRQIGPTVFFSFIEVEE